MNDFKISIIVPIYNSEKFLEQCLQSIVSQTYNNIEIVCVNDGSSDQSIDILLKYQKADPRVFIYTKINGGLSSARNYGMQHVTGDYVMFVDSDDWIDATICEMALNKALSKDYDLVFWSYTREFVSGSRTKDVIDQQEHTYDDSGCRLLHRRLFGLLGPELSSPDKGDSLVTAWGKLYKRSVVNQIEFIDTNIIGTEDAMFNIQAFKNIHSAAFIPCYSYHYRKYNTDSLTTKYNPYLFERWQRMYYFMAKEILRYNYPIEYKQALYNRRALGLIALGQNIVFSGKTTCQQIREFKDILSDSRYKHSFEKLDFLYLPLVWKIFFAMARLDFATGVYFLSLCIKKIRGK